MKKIIIIVFILFSAIIYAQNNSINNDIENIIIRETSLLIKINNLENILNCANKYMFFLPASAKIGKFKSWLKDIKAETGIDVLDKESLRKAGIATGKQAAFASSLFQGKEFSVIYVPVSSRQFASNMINLFKKQNSSKSENNPEAENNEHGILRINDNFFCIFLERYFIGSSSPEILKHITGIQLNKKDSIADDSFYKDFSATAAGDHNIHVFLKKPAADIASGVIPENTLSDTSTIAVPETHTISGTQTSVNNTGKIDYSDIFRYTGITIDLKPEKIEIHAHLAINNDSAGSELKNIILTNRISTGKHFENPSSYLFSSLDIKALNKTMIEISKKNSEISDKYFKASALFREYTGIDFAAGDIDCLQGIINSASFKPAKSGEFDNFIIFLPGIAECENSDTLMEMAADIIKKKYSSDRRGSESNDNFTTNWFINDQGTKINIIKSGKDYYITNDISIFKSATATEKNTEQMKSCFPEDIGENTFFLSYTKFDNDSLLKAILSMLLFQTDPGLYYLVNRIDCATLTGTRTDDRIRLNLNIGFQK